MLSSEIENTAEISAATHAWHAAATQACMTVASAASRIVRKEGKRSRSKRKAGEHGGKLCSSSK